MHDIIVIMNEQINIKNLQVRRSNFPILVEPHDEQGLGLFLSLSVSLYVNYNTIHSLFH